MTDSITTYSFKDIEPQEYKRTELTPYQIAKQRSIILDMPDPDVLTHITIDGKTTTYENRVLPNGTTELTKVSDLVKNSEDTK